MDPDALVCVYKLKNPHKAELIQNFLESRDITCCLSGAGQGDFVGLFDIRILVRQINADLVKRLLKAYLECEAEVEIGETE